MDKRVPMPPSKSSFIYTPTIGSEASQDLLAACVELFSTNYGMWGEAGFKPGQPVNLMNANKLKNQCLSVPESTVLVSCTKGNTLVGYAFATVWLYEGGCVAWVTQLVVDKYFRKRYVATTLLQTFKSHLLFQDITAMGLVSSHPAAVNALTKYSCVNVAAIDLGFIRNNAQKILEVTPINYLNLSQMSLHGSLFDPAVNDGSICSVCTDFFVDHGEPLDALAVFKAQNRWCLGDLLDGHEYLVIVPVIDQSN